MTIYSDIIQAIFSLALFINAVLFIPQSIRIIREKSAKGLSLITFIGFFLINLAIVLHGIIEHDFLLTWGYIASLVTIGAVVILILLYRKRQRSNTNITLEEIIAQLPGHVYWKDRDGVFLGSNTNNWKDFGMTSLDEHIGKTDHDLFPEAEANEVIKNDQKVMQTGHTQIVEELLTNADKTKSSYLSHKIPLKNNHGKIIGVLGVSIDITTAKKETERQLNTLENIIAIMPGNVYWMDKHGVYLGCNDNEAKAVGLTSRKDIIGKKNVDIPGFVIPEALDPINKKIIETGETIVIEEPAVLPNGKTVTFLSSKVPMKDENGVVTGLVGISVDISAEKRAKQLEQEKSLAQERAKLMKLLAGGIAHEMRTPLGTMSAVSERIRRITGPLALPEDLPAEKLKYLQTVPAILDHTINKANNFINMLLQKVKSEEGTIAADEVLSIQAILQKALNEYHDTHSVEIDVNTETDFCFKGDEEAFIHVIFNLLKNAIFYVQKARKGKIAIWAECGEAYNILHFKDTGTGMSAEALTHIFDHYYSQTRHGTGIGLAYCQLVMNSFGGNIECDAKDGQYTYFTLRFPVLEAQSAGANST